VLIFLDSITNLFNLAAIVKPYAAGLQRLIYTSSATRGSLLSLGSANDIMNAIMITLVLSKVDADKRLSYDEKLSFDQLPNLDDFAKRLLTHRWQCLEGRQRISIKTRQGDSYQKPKSFPTSKSKSFVTSYHYISHC